MINIKKGTGLTLAQVSKVGNAKAGEAVVAGMAVHFGITSDDGNVLKGGIAAGLVGLAINNQTDGDVIESGKIGVYLLDGASVIETDQVYDTVNATNFPVGAAVYALDNGLLSKTDTDSNKQIGVVEGIRDLPANGNVSINAASNGLTPVVNYGGVNKVQGIVTVLGVKLGA